MAVSHTELQQFSPFANLGENQFESIRPYLKKENVAKGEFLIKRGRPLKGLTFLLSGRVDLVDVSFNSESVDGDAERAREALTDKSPSDVSALAKTDTVVIQVDHEAMEVLKAWDDVAPLPEFSSPPPMTAAVHDGEDWMSSLLNSPLFTQIPPAQLQQLFVRFEALEVAEGETVIQENQDGDFFYVIERGQARVINRFDGEVARLGPGQFFGQEALVGETIRNASVIMDSDGVLMRLNKEDFKALLQEPLLRYISDSELSKRLSEGQEISVLDVRLPLEHRLGHVADSTNIPLAALRKRLRKFDPAPMYVITDDGGKRSEVAAYLMCQVGLNACILENAGEHYGEDSAGECGDSAFAL